MKKPLANEKLKRRMSWQGLDLGIEYAKGDMRFGKPMLVDYGHIRGLAPGADGEAADFYFGHNPASAEVFEIRQMRQEGEEVVYDESKWMFGYDSAVEAEYSYRLHTLPEMFGSIRHGNLNELYAMRLQQESWVVLEESADGLPTVVLNRVLPANKESRNDRIYLDMRGEIKRAVEGLAAIVAEEGWFPIFYDHPQLRNPENRIAEGFSIWYDDKTTEVYGKYRLLHNTPGGLEVAQRIKNGDLPASSIVTDSACSEGNTGYCVIKFMFGYDILRPESVPGIPGSGAVRVVEQSQGCGGCSQAAPCEECRESLPVLTESVPDSSGGQKKESNMNLKNLLESLFNSAQTWETAQEKVKTLPGFTEERLTEAKKIWDDIQFNAAAEALAKSIAEATATAVTAQSVTSTSNALAGQATVSTPAATPVVPAALNPEAKKMPMDDEPDAACEGMKDYEKEMQEMLAERRAAKAAAKLERFIKESLLPNREFEGVKLEAFNVGDLKEATDNVLELKPTTQEQATILIRAEVKRLKKALAKTEAATQPEGPRAPVVVQESREWMELVDQTTQASLEVLRSKDFGRYQEVSDNMKSSRYKELASAKLETWKRLGGEKLAVANVRHNNRMKSDPGYNAMVRGMIANNGAYRLPVEELHGGVPNATEALITEGVALPPLSTDTVANAPIFLASVLQYMWSEADFMAFMGLAGEGRFVKYSGGMSQDIRVGRHLHKRQERFQPAAVNFNEYELYGKDDVPVEAMMRAPFWQEAFTVHRGMSFAQYDAEAQQLFNGPFNINLAAMMTAWIGGEWGRSTSRRAHRHMFNNAAKYKSKRKQNEDCATTEVDIQSSGALPTITVNGEAVQAEFATTNGSSTATDPTYGGYGVWAVVRLKGDQSATGSSIEPIVVVEPEEKLAYSESGGVPSLTWTFEGGTAFAGDLGGDPIVMGNLRFDPDGVRIVPKHPGQVPTAAIYPKYGFLLISNAASSAVTAYSDITNLDYYYNRAVYADNTTGNVVKHQLNLGSETRADNIQRLLQTIAAQCGAKKQFERGYPTLALIDYLIGTNLIPKAKNWQADSIRIGMGLNSDFTNAKGVAQSGAVNFWQTNSETLTGSRFFPVIVPYDSEYALSEGMVISGPDKAYMTPTGSAVGDLSNKRVRKARVSTWDQYFQDLMVTWRFKDEVTGKRIQEPSFIVQLLGNLTTALSD